MDAKPFNAEFFVRGDPKGQPRPRAFAFNGKARMYDPATAEGWKTLIAAVAKPWIPFPPLLGPVRLTLLFQFPRPKTHFRTGRNAGILRDDAPYRHVAKPDFDNLAKAVSDCLKTLGFFKDDSQLCSGPIDKIYSDVPGCNIRIESLAHETFPREGTGAGEGMLPLRGLEARA